MIVGQLWYGWARFGVEGVDREQIVAASGALGDRRQPVIAAVLPRCYCPQRPSFAWAEVDGFTVVLRRTPNGLDSRGRTGAFFVHALVAQRGDLDGEMLAGLHRADLWRLGPPDEPVEQLPPLTERSELGLGTVDAVDEDLVVAALAGYLANLAAQRRSSIDIGETIAVALAARFVALVPARFGLLAFSTGEDADHVAEYGLVAGPPPTAAFAPIVVGETSEGWVAAARALVDAAAGDAAATGMVGCVSERATSLSAFAETLFEMTALARGGTGAGVSPALWQRCAEQPGILRWVLEKARASSLAQAVVGRVPGAIEALRSTPADLVGNELATAFVESWSALPAGEAVEGLQELVRETSPLGRAVTRRLVLTWSQAGTLDTLDGSDVLGLLELLAGEGGEIAREELALIACAAGTAQIVSAARLPLGLRIAAAEQHPGVVPAELVGQLLVQEPRIGTALLATRDPALFDTVDAAIEAAPASDGVEIAKAAHRADAGRFVRSLYDTVGRLDQHARFTQLRSLSSARVVYGHPWNDRLLDAYVEQISTARRSGLPLPQLRLELLNGPSGARVQDWQALLTAVQLVREMGASTAATRRMMRALLRLGIERTTAMEVVYDALVARSHSDIAWGDAVDELVMAGEPVEDVVAGLVRAARRDTRSQLSATAAQLTLWLGRRLEDGSLDRKRAGKALKNELRPLLTVPVDRSWLLGCAAGLRDKAARSWIEDVVCATRTERKQQSAGSR